MTSVSNEHDRCKPAGASASNTAGQAAQPNEATLSDQHSDPEWRRRKDVVSELLKGAPSTPFANQKQSPRSRHRARAEKAANGSLRAAIDLKCVECNAWDLVEAKRCEIVGCPLWPVSMAAKARGGAR